MVCQSYLKLRLPQALVEPLLELIPWQQLAEPSAGLLLCAAPGASAVLLVMTLRLPPPSFQAAAKHVVPSNVCACESVTALAQRSLVPCQQEMSPALTLLTYLEWSLWSQPQQFLWFSYNYSSGFLMPLDAWAGPRC